VYNEAIIRSTVNRDVLPVLATDRKTCPIWKTDVMSQISEEWSHISLFYVRWSKTRSVNDVAGWPRRVFINEQDTWSKKPFSDTIE